MSSKRGSICVVILLLVLAPRAGAVDFERSGVYVGLSGSYAIDMAVEEDLKPLEFILGPDIDVKVEDSFGIQGRVGYRFHPHLAAELQVEYLLGFDIEIEGLEVLSYETITTTSNAKLFLATKDIQPYALVGAGVLYWKIEDSVGVGFSHDAIGPAFRSGGGFDFYFSENVVLNVDATYVIPFRDTEGLDYLSIGFGVQYRF
jgi:outer membrane protein W